MNMLNRFRQWLGESRRNQLLAAGAALVAGGALAAVGVVVAVSGGGDRQEQVIARTATPSPAVETPTRTPRRTTTASPTPEPAVETLAFLRDGDIWLINADGTGERRLTSRGDGQSFSWVSREELDLVTGQDRSGHLLVDLRGNVRELPFPAGGSWSRDGGRYAVPVEEHIVVFDRDLGEIGQLQPGASLDECPERPASDPVRYRVQFGRPSFTRDGREILVAAHCWPRSGAYNFYGSIYRAFLDGTVTTQLPDPEDGPQLNLRGLAGPLFSPDGRRIAWAYTDGFSLCPTGRSLVVANADGANRRGLGPAAVSALYSQTPLPETFGGISGFDWAPESDAIVAAYQVYVCGADADPSAEAAVSGLYILNPDEAGEQQLVEGEAHSPSWSPSGRFVAYVTGRYFGEPTQPPAIRLFDLTTRQTTDLVQGSLPAWQPQP